MFPRLEAGVGTAEPDVLPSRLLLRGRRSRRPHRRQQLPGRTRCHRGRGTHHHRSEDAKSRHRPQADGGRAGSRARAQLRRSPPGPGRVSQSFAFALHHAGLRCSRAAGGDARAGHQENFTTDSRCAQRSHRIWKRATSSPLRVHGHHRGGELSDGIQQGTARLSSAAAGSPDTPVRSRFTDTPSRKPIRISRRSSRRPTVSAGPGILVPSRNAELFRWCLANGLRVVQPMTLMSLGLYNEPKGAFLPSVLY